MGENGFDEYKRLYEERHQENKEAHRQILEQLQVLTAAVQTLKSDIAVNSVKWSVVASIAVILTYLFLPTLITGCK